MGLLSFVGKIVGKVLRFTSLLPRVLDYIKPDTPDREGLTVNREGSNLAIPIVYGNQRVGSIKVHKYVTGDRNQFLNLICVWCEGEIDGVEDILFNGVSSTDDRFAGHFTVSNHLGSPTQTADSQAVSNIPNWTSAHRLQGLAYSYIRLEIDDNQTIWRGEPEISAIIRGRKVYDPRLDSTVGGTGTQRVNNPSTWTYSPNPALCLRDYLTNTIYGKELENSRVDNQSIVNAANLCDEGVEVTETVTTFEIIENQDGTITRQEVTNTVTRNLNRFECNIIVDTERLILDNVGEMLGTFRGILNPQNILMPIIETTGTPLFTFNEDNIVGDIEVDSGTINDRYNRVIIRYPNIRSNFEYDEAFYPEENDPIRATWLSEDNDKNLERQFTFNGIIHKNEALQMAEILAKRSRFGLSINIDVQPTGILYQPGDIVGVTDTTHGWVNKPFRITNKFFVEDGLVRFRMMEHEDSVYPWSGRSYNDRQGGTFLGDPFNIQAPTNLAFTSDLTLASVGTLTWQSPSNAFRRRSNVVVERTAELDGTVLNPAVQIFDNEVLGNAYVLPLVDAGTYNLIVYDISSIGTRSPSATLNLPLTLPITPTAIALFIGNWEVTAAPSIPNQGSGTLFQFDIVRGDGSGHTPVPENGTGADTFTFTGLVPSTQYTVFARAVNAFGESPYFSRTFTTTFTTEQIEPYIGPINDRIQDAEDALNDLRDEESPFGNLEIINIIDTITGVAENSINSESIRTETRERRSETSNLTTRITTTEGDLTAAVTRIDSAEVNINGNASAISGVTTQINDPATGLTATAGRVSTVESTANGNVTAISALQSTVNNPTTGLAATATIATEARGTANTAVARVYLTAAANNRIVGVILNNDGTQRTIDFQADAVRFFDTAGNARIRYDTTNQRYVFDGEIIAVNSTFTGTITGSRGIFTNGLNAAFNDAFLQVGVDNGQTTSNTVRFGRLNTSIETTGLSWTIVGANGVIIRSTDRDEEILLDSDNVRSSGNFSTANPISIGGTAVGNRSNFSHDVRIDGDLTVTGQINPATLGHPSILNKRIKPEVGDLIEDVDVEIIDENNAIGKYRICKTPKCKNIIGAYTHTDEKEKWVLSNGIGEGVMNVCGKNGNIKQGDLLVSSSVKGKAMKQDDDLIRSYTVAKARQSVDFESETDVKQIAVFYMCG